LSAQSLVNAEAADASLPLGTVIESVLAAVSRLERHCWWRFLGESVVGKEGGQTGNRNRNRTDAEKARRR
jgi:hypothetical protein